MHTHPFLASHQFEVASQAKDIKLKKDIDILERKQTHYDGQDRTESQLFGAKLDELKEEAKKKEDSRQTRMRFRVIKNRIEDFTTKLFGQSG
jgi:hypothetical protein